ncbi:MAG: hypothetical protein WCJ95_18220 [Mariniphaga sp.]
MPKKQRRDWEKEFEDHFCHRLNVKGEYRIYRDSEIKVDKVNCIHWDRLEQFWDDTQKNAFNAVKTELSYDWKNELGKKIGAELQIKPLFQLLRDGLKINSQHHLDLVYFKPQTCNNKEQDPITKRIYSVLSGNIISPAEPMPGNRKMIAKALIWCFA